MYVKSPTIYDGIMPKPKVPIGYILYAVFLPVIGLFLERYAYSAVVAIVLWVLVLILMAVSCALDKRILDQQEVNTITLGKSYLFPPIYIYKRQVLVGGEAMLSVACITLMIGALLTNGFIKGLRVNADSIDELVQNSYISQLDNFSGNSNVTIGDCVNTYSSKQVSWKVEQKDYGFDITAEGTHDSKDFVISIKLEFDGFTYHSFYIQDITVSGKSLEKDEKKDFLQKCFIDNRSNASDNSSAASSSSS